MILMNLIKKDSLFSVCLCLRQREKNYDRVWPCINISFGYPFQLCPKKNMTISNLSHSLIVSQANICEEDLYSINTLMVTKMDDMQTPFFIVELYEF